MLKIQIIIGSTRQKRSGHIPAQWILSELQKNADTLLEELIWFARLLKTAREK